MQPVVGGVFASYSQDVHTEAMWYRVLVRELKDGNVKIEFVDYGDTGLVPVSALKPIPQRFLDLPFQVTSTTVDSLVSGHPREMKKVSVSGAIRLRECPLAES